MGASILSARLVLIFGAAATAATLATACAQIIGADFDVKLGAGGGEALAEGR